jgi:NAD(P)-dependent dehydrogenase (short-subunit alcohol dehydrogenase family)
MDLNLEGKVGMITGGSQGLGSATATCSLPRARGWCLRPEARIGFRP